MVVKPTLLTHPKFLAFEKAVGPDALKFLVRLWGHCETEQRGGRWNNATGAYVETVCQWNGEPDKLFKALVASPTPSGFGFVEKTKTGLVIHDWAEVNAGLVHAWTARRGTGTKKKRYSRGLRGGSPDVSAETQLNLTGPPDRRGVEGSGSEKSEGEETPPSGVGGDTPTGGRPPSLGQIIQHAVACGWPYSGEEIAAAVESFRASAQPDGRWVWGRRVVTDWAAALSVRLRDSQKNSGLSAGAELVALRAQLAELNRDMEELDGRPDSDVQLNRLARKRTAVIAKIEAMTNPK